MNTYYLSPCFLYARREVRCWEYVALIKTFKIPVFVVLNTLDIIGYKTINIINKEMTL